MSAQKRINDSLLSESVYCWPHMTQKQRFECIMQMLVYSDGAARIRIPPGPKDSVIDAVTKKFLDIDNCTKYMGAAWLTQFNYRLTVGEAMIACFSREGLYDEVPRKEAP